MKTRGLILAAVLLLPGCATGPAGAGKITWWNPLTYFSGHAGRKAVKAEASRNDARADVLHGAQIAAHETLSALESAGDSRPVQVARESADTAAAMMDQALGPLTVQTRADLQRRVMLLLSENDQMRLQGEAEREKTRQGMAGLSDHLSRMEKALRGAQEQLGSAFVRENALANKARNWLFGAIGLAVLVVVVLGALAWVNATMGGLPAALGKGLVALRAKHPEAADYLTQILDAPLSKRIQAKVAKFA